MKVAQQTIACFSQKHSKSTRLLNQQKSDDLNNTQSFKTILSSQHQRLTDQQVDRHSRRQLGQVALASVLHKHHADWANIVFLFSSTLHPLAQECCRETDGHYMKTNVLVCHCVPVRALAGSDPRLTERLLLKRLHSGTTSESHVLVPQQHSHQLPCCVSGSPKPVTNNT